MKNIKNFESWNNNIIDKTLFTSGKAKYDPKVVNGIIKYKTGNIEPYYFAEIIKKGNKFICKIYKKNKDGESKRLRNKLKSELKLSHNYVREFLNQRLKKDEKKGDDNSDEIFRNKKSTQEPMYNDMVRDITPEPRQLPVFSEPKIKPKRKTIIRRFY
jgi:hypothetical protein